MYDPDGMNCFGSEEGRELRVDRSTWLTSYTSKYRGLGVMGAVISKRAGNGGKNDYGGEGMCRPGVYPVTSFISDPV